MRRKTLPTLTTAAAAAAFVLAAPGSTATAATAPAAPEAPAVRSPAADEPVLERQAGEGLAGQPASRSAAAVAAEAPAAPRPPLPRPSDRAYPRQTVLPVPAVNPADAAIKLGLTPYHAIAPRLNDLQLESDRVSVEVLGQSHLGRDLYLVTVTAPETRWQAQRQERIRRLIESDPRAAAARPALLAGYKAPYLVNGNIHGNEWEGTDGILQVVEELARSTDPAVAEMLERTRFHAVVSMNPDGRVAGTRANAAGFDMNRDFITGSQPEVVAMRQALIDIQPLVFLDQHGYVSGTLLEPTTAPHGQNYEYDLYIKHALPNALAMEAALEAAVAEGRIPDAAPGEVDPFIPFRDRPAGDWDDWPPIFTPMYSMYHGSVGHTIEFPLRVNNADYLAADTPEEVAELQRRARVNTDVVVETIRASLAYLDASRAELLADQIEIFRRGLAGEPDRELPVGYVEGWAEDDQGYTAEYPRAYVIPAGATQRSEAAAARLVDHLVANDVRVERARRAFTLADRRYPAGSYVVDMHQPKRGLANVMLEAGRDISDRVPQMYDISGWSHSLLWGATVDAVAPGAVAGELAIRSRPVTVAAPTGGVAAPAGRDLALALVDAKEVQALNALLAQGVAARLADDGSVVVPASARAAAREVADRFGVRFTAAPRGATGLPLEEVTVAAAAGADELAVLSGMGFDVTPVSTASLNTGFDWAGVDVLYVSAGLNLVEQTDGDGAVLVPGLLPEARAALEAFLDDGGVVAQGGVGAAFNTAADLLTATGVAGRTDANGVVNVGNEGGPVTAGALPHTFVYAPVWFTDLGDEVAVEQRYSPTDVLVAGHWIATAEGAGGQEAAAGQASVVRGEDESGASVVLFGTEPMFRDHPKGLYSQVARSLYLTSATAGTEVTAP